MRILAGAVLILALAACSKQEPPPAHNAGAASPNAAASSAHKAPPAAEPTPAAAGAGLPRDQKISATATAPTPSSGPELLARGEAVFKTTCATCHMADGGGVPYLQPSIKGSAWISNPDPQLLLTLILRGSAVLGEAAKAYDNDMPPVDALNDADLAAVATYVRSRFGTPPISEPVTPAQAAVARARPGLPE